MDRFGDLILELGAVEEKEPKVVFGLNVALDAPIDPFEVQVLVLVVLVGYLDLVDVFYELICWQIPLVVVLHRCQLFLALVLLIDLVQEHGSLEVEKNVLQRES